MTEKSGEYNGFYVEFQTAGTQGPNLHSFLSSRVAHGSVVTEKIRDTLNDAAQTIADLIAKEERLNAKEPVSTTLVKEIS